MARHACPRCGLESRRDTWADRHPVATVFIAVPTLYTLIGVMLVYPWFTIPVTIIVCAMLVNRAARRRAAIAARADHEHRALIAKALKWHADPQPLALQRPARSRPADYGSIITQPIRRCER